mmetsp:Transcript_53415/g.125307  ORF Transcript_53415/g.125307 Transcript_53415/m.125307 type:complete len:231 (+) Transcript_53415:196-888(+)
MAGQSYQSLHIIDAKLASGRHDLRSHAGTAASCRLPGSGWSTAAEWPGAGSLGSWSRRGLSWHRAPACTQRVHADSGREDRRTCRYTDSGISQLGRASLPTMEHQCVRPPPPGQGNPTKPAPDTGWAGPYHWASWGPFARPASTTARPARHTQCISDRTKGRWHTFATATAKFALRRSHDFGQNSESPARIGQDRECLQKQHRRSGRGGLRRPSERPRWRSLAPVDCTTR